MSSFSIPKKKRNKDGLVAYGFLTPWLIGMFLLTLGAMAFTVYMSFTSYDLLSSPEWIGTENYKNIFKDSEFWGSVKVTLIFVVLSVPARLVFSLIIALLLAKPIKGIGMYRALIYLPSLMGTSVGASIGWKKVFDENGPINSFLEVFGIDGPIWLGHGSTAMFVLILLSVWQFGSEMIIFLAGLKQVPNHLYEAATIDGAGRIRKFFSITWPMITPLVFFNLLMGTINAFMIFTQVYIITGGGPMSKTMMYILYLYKHGFTFYNMGYAAALAIILLLVIAFFSALIFLTSKFWVKYDV